jgi:lysophospholipase L1-like esterase
MNVRPIASTGTYAQLVNAQVPSRFPTQEGGGIGGLTSRDGARLLKSWLAAYPGRYVGLSYGTNDGRTAVDPATFYGNYAAMVRAVIAAGKTPVVPKIPWARAPHVLANAPAYNAQIGELYRAYPEIIPGPDFWAYFLEHQDLIAADDVHPTEAGYAAYRQQWADTMVQRVYQVGK